MAESIKRIEQQIEALKRKLATAKAKEKKAWAAGHQQRLAAIGAWYLRKNGLPDDPDLQDMPQGFPMELSEKDFLLWRPKPKAKAEPKQEEAAKMTA